MMNLYQVIYARIKVSVRRTMNSLIRPIYKNGTRRALSSLSLEEESGNQRAIFRQCVFCQPAQSNTNRELSYSHYYDVTLVLNLLSKDIQFPMTLSRIKKFENLNIFINVYGFEKQKEMTILPLRLTGMKRDKHINLLYV